MAANLTDDNFKCILVNEKELKYVPRSLNDNKPVLIQVMTGHRTGNKPLPEPILTQFLDA